MSKYVGKFRKNQDYNDDYGYDIASYKDKKRNRNEHSEIKKLKNYNYDELLDLYDNEEYQKDSRRSRRSG